MFLIGLLAALALVAPAAARPAAAAAEPEQLCEITITVPGQWATGYMVNITVRNISNRPVTVSGTATLQPPGFVIQGWNAVFTVSGAVLWIRPWNPLLPPGASMTFGYTATGPVVVPTVYCS